MYAPIIIFAYNRPQHLRRLLNSLLLNPESGESCLHIYADGPKGDGDPNVGEVRALISQISGFKKVRAVFREKNMGLAANIIDGVSEVFSGAESRAIVMEDDLVATPYFLRYMNAALNHYECMDVWSIAGYSPRVSIPDGYGFSTYPIMRNCSWGWATWRSRWRMADWDVSDFDDFIRDRQARKAFNESGTDLAAMLMRQHCGEIGSWSIRFCYSGFRHNMPTIYPVRSLVINGGADGSGSNVEATCKYDTCIFEELGEIKFCNNLSVNPIILKSFRNTYNCSIVRRLINWWKRMKYTR